MTLASQSRALRIVALILLGCGLLFCATVWAPLQPVYTFFADLVIWPATDTHRPLSAEARLNLAIMGGLMAGLGAIWWMAAGAPLHAAPEPVRKMLLAGAVVWFVTDSAASVLAGASANVLPNAGFFLLLIWPIWRPVQQG